MTTTEKAKAIRSILKTNGLTRNDVSVKTRIGGYSASITIHLKNENFKKEDVKRMVLCFHSVDYDQFGEILAGGNTFIFVEDMNGYIA